MKTYLKYDGTMRRWFVTINETVITFKNAKSAFKFIYDVAKAV